MARDAALVLADGSMFEGELLGADPAGGISPAARSCSTPSLSGYQEVITDPSYAGQIITFTTRTSATTASTLTDFESRRPFCRGVIVRDLARRHSNQRAEASLDALLRRYGISGHRRHRHPPAHPAAPRHRRDARRVRHRATARRCRPRPPPSRAPTASTSSPRSPRPTPYTVGPGDAPGTSSPTTSASSSRSCATSPRSARCTSCRRRRRRPRCSRCEPTGVFLSNGPGDPAEVGYAVEAIRELLGEVPMFGICLGHQLLSRALGGETFKLPVRPPRRQPPGAPRGDRQGRDHQPEPQLLRRPDSRSAAGSRSPTSTSTT